MPYGADLSSFQSFTHFLFSLVDEHCCPEYHSTHLALLHPEQVCNHDESGVWAKVKLSQDAAHSKSNLITFCLSCNRLIPLLEATVDCIQLTSGLAACYNTSSKSAACSEGAGIFISSIPSSTLQSSPCNSRTPYKPVPDDWWVLNSKQCYCIWNYPQAPGGPQFAWWFDPCASALLQ